MTMIDQDFCKLCIENDHEVELVAYESGQGKFCPCCDRLEQGAFHDIKDESEIELPDDGIGPSDFS